MKNSSLIPYMEKAGFDFLISTFYCYIIEKKKKNA